MNYTITLEALAPLHVGSGEQISKKDCLYLSNERKVYILDNAKVFSGMKKLGLLKEYENYLMDERQKNFTFFVRDHRIAQDEYKSWAAYTLPLDDISDTLTQSRSKGGSLDNIAGFMKDAYGCPYIPGSSLKGAIRTAIQNTLVEKNRGRFGGIANSIPTAEFRSRTKYLSYENGSLSEELFNTLGLDEKKKRNAVNDIFRGLRVSDSKPLSVSDLILCQKIDVKPDGTFASLPIKRECLRPGTKITFSLEIADEFFGYDSEKILAAIDTFYRQYRQGFLSAFRTVSTAENHAGRLIYLGGGTGFATKTSVYPLYADREKEVRAVEKIIVNTTSTKKQRDPHKHSEDSRKYRVSPHTRKCTKYRGVLYDMGLCRIDIK